MQTWQQLLPLTNEQLAQMPIEDMNWACAEGLPGAPTEAEKTECKKRLTECVKAARQFTDRCLAGFRRHPETYNHSEAQFRVTAMVTAL